MKTYICEICGDAYIGEEKPSECPFCGARQAFIKDGKDAKPIVNQFENIGEVSRKNLQATYDLEVNASAIYTCIANKAKDYEIKAMYKRLAKVELEHAVVVSKLCGISMPVIEVEACSAENVENFKRTIELEEHATDLYAQFGKEATEKSIKIFFTALTQMESDHIKLIKNYL